MSSAPMRAPAIPQPDTQPHQHGGQGLGEHDASQDFPSESPRERPTSSSLGSRSVTPSRVLRNTEKRCQHDHCHLDPRRCRTRGSAWVEGQRGTCREPRVPPQKVLGRGAAPEEIPGRTPGPTPGQSPQHSTEARPQVAEELAAHREAPKGRPTAPGAGSTAGSKAPATRPCQSPRRIREGPGNPRRRRALPSERGPLGRRRGRGGRRTPEPHDGPISSSRRTGTFFRIPGQGGERGYRVPEPGNEPWPRRETCRSSAKNPLPPEAFEAQSICCRVTMHPAQWITRS